MQQSQIAYAYYSRPQDPIENALDAQDFLVYEQMYAEALQQKKKPRPDATMPGKISHEGEPLDFSFLKLQDVTALRKERPRGGKRIAIEKDEEEEDAKKDAAAAVVDEKAEGDPKEGK